VAVPEHWWPPTRATCGFSCFGFEKNERANISAEEKEALQAIAQDLLSRTRKELDAVVEDGSLQEICHDDKD
jgi:Uncharacterized protein conserved in bacteria